MHGPVRWLRRALAVLALALAVPAAADTVLRVAYPETENPPRILGHGAAVPDDKPGISVELLRLAADKVGVRLEFTRVPWKRCLYLLENGYVDATFHASYTEERTRYAVYPTRAGRLDTGRAIYRNRYAIYAPKGAGIGWDGQTLSNVGKPLGTLAGNAVADDLKRLGAAVEEAPGVRSNMDKLKSGRIAAYVEIEGIGDEFLAEHRAEFVEIEKLPLPLQDKHYFLIVAKPFYQRHPELAEAFFDAIRDVQATPAYRRMVTTYR
ncbi:substrate-binding periplasmic protein [Azospira restricta]|uniref:Transporter substrate-binding domain-containing protein n=1 Tax=Azospira restricta TaxID=404405 RepID=A0A974PXR4_9RHOO|nr:transporter substrate-binding domain-containing protein [Azospira restricta]QRJ63078.1 transporter substrate-binding domain-containing protein [Azospira restricta]